MFLANSYLTMPAVFSQTGWVGGILLYSVVCLINTYTMMTILDVTRIVGKKRMPNGEFKAVRSYSDVAYRL